MPRVQAVILPRLRSELTGVTVGSWTPQVNHRLFPYLNVRRLGGSAVNPKLLDRAVIEMTVYARGGVEVAEDHYLDARQVLWEMVDRQIVIPDVGHLHSLFETMGMTPFDSPFEDTWRVQGLIQLGIRPARNT